MLALSAPTVNATAALAVLVKLRLPGPNKPPRVAAVWPPKLRQPLPLVSSVLFCSAKGWANCNVPLEISVLPLYVLAAPRMSVPDPAMVNVPTWPVHALPRIGSLRTSPMTPLMTVLPPPATTRGLMLRSTDPPTVSCLPAATVHVCGAPIVSGELIETDSLATMPLLVRISEPPVKV